MCPKRTLFISVVVSVVLWLLPVHAYPHVVSRQLESNCQCDCCYTVAIHARTECIPPTATSFSVVSCSQCDVHTCATHFATACAQVSSLVSATCIKREGWMLRVVPITFIAIAVCLLVYGLCVRKYDGYHDDTRHFNRVSYHTFDARQRTNTAFDAAAAAAAAAAVRQPLSTIVEERHQPDADTHLSHQQPCATIASANATNAFEPSPLAQCANSPSQQPRNHVPIQSTSDQPLQGVTEHPDILSERTGKHTTTPEETQPVTGTAVADHSTRDHSTRDHSTNLGHSASAIAAQNQPTQHVRPIKSHQVQPLQHTSHFAHVSPQSATDEANAVDSTRANQHHLGVQHSQSPLRPPQVQQGGQKHDSVQPDVDSASCTENSMHVRSDPQLDGIDQSGHISTCVDIATEPVPDEQSASLNAPPTEIDDAVEEPKSTTSRSVVQLDTGVSETPVHVEHPSCLSDSEEIRKSDRVADDIQAARPTPNDSQAQATDAEASGLYAETFTEMEAEESVTASSERAVMNILRYERPAQILGARYPGEQEGNVDKNVATIDGDSLLPCGTQNSDCEPDGTVMELQSPAHTETPLTAESIIESENTLQARVQSVSRTEPQLNTEESPVMEETINNEMNRSIESPNNSDDEKARGGNLLEPSTQVECVNAPQLPLAPKTTEVPPEDKSKVEDIAEIDDTFPAETDSIFSHSNVEAKSATGSRESAHVDEDQDTSTMGLFQASTKDIFESDSGLAAKGTGTQEDDHMHKGLQLSDKTESGEGDRVQSNTKVDIAPKEQADVSHDTEC